jgi:hypothetical protein
MWLGLRFCIDKWLLIRLELRLCIYTVTYAFRTFRLNFCGFRVRRPGLRFPAFLLCVVTPLCIYSRFVDVVGVTVLYRQMAIDSVGVTALYIHGDLCFPYVSAELLRVSDSAPRSFYAWLTPLCIYTADLLIRLGLRFCIDKFLLIRWELRRCIYTVAFCSPSAYPRGDPRLKPQVTNPFDALGYGGPRRPKETQGDPRLKPWATSLGLPALGYQPWATSLGLLPRSRFA